MEANGLKAGTPYLDAHIHLWQLSDGERFWLRDKIAGLYRDFTEEDLRALRGKCNVGGAILVQAYHSVADSLKLLRLAEGSDQLAGVLAWIDIFSPSLEKDVARYRESRKFVGLRPMPPDTFGGNWLTDERSELAIRVLQELDCSIDVLQPVESLKRTAAFLHRFPDLRVVLDHGGRPAVMTGALEPWRTDIRELAARTTTVVKCSGLVERAGVEWSKRSVKPYVTALLEAFGSKRVMFATNWPVVTISSTYDLWVRTLVEILDELGLTQDEKDDVMWRVASRHYRIAWPAPEKNAGAMSPHSF